MEANLAMLLDVHCHVDHYDDPLTVPNEAERRGVFILSVTNLPSHFEEGQNHLRRYANVRGALGMHPLHAGEHSGEMSAFRRLLDCTTFVGEVGLDGSREAGETMAVQEKSLDRILAAVSGSVSGKILSLHSRRAEKRVLSLLQEHRIRKAVFHWYSGPLGLVDDILASGYYFSINPKMCGTEHGQKLLSRIPMSRMLTETDGPFAGPRGRPYMPWDAAIALAGVAAAKECTERQAREAVWANFRDLTGSPPKVPVRPPRRGTVGEAVAE